MLRVSLFLLAIPLMAQRIGDVVSDVSGVPVSTHTGTLPSITLRGSPAIVIGTTKDRAGRPWVRLLAADGSSGWTSRTFTGHPSRITAPATLQLAPREPGDPSFSPSDDARPISAANASITGAALIGRVPSPQQLKIPARLNPFLAPWLKIQAASIVGWIAPSEIELAWEDTLPLDGIIRPPFLRQFSAGLKPAPGQPALLFENIQSDPSASAMPTAANWEQPNLALRAAPDLVSFPGSSGTALVFPHVGSALVSHGHPVVVAYRLADLDGGQQLVLQLVSTEGDGYTTVLWIINGAASKNGRLIITPITLGGSSGEPGGSTVDAEWWVDASTVWITRTQNSRIEFSAVPATSKAYAVLSGTFPTAESAAQSALQLHQNQIPWTTKSWAVGRLFRNRDDAVAWRKQVALPKSSLHEVPLQP